MAYTIEFDKYGAGKAIRVIEGSDATSAVSYDKFLNACNAVSSNFVVIDIHVNTNQLKVETVGLVYFPALSDGASVQIINGNTTF